MGVRQALFGFGLCAVSIATLATRAGAITIEDARTAIDGILMQSGISATEVDARVIDGDGVELVFDAISLDMRGYSTDRELVMDDVLIKVRDTDNPDHIDIDVQLPEKANMLAEATSDQRDLTLRNAGAYVRWDMAQNAPVTLDGFADMVVGDEPISRKHSMVSGLLIQWLPELARIAWQGAEWTGPNREKRGSIKATSFTLYPGQNGETNLDYAHDGLWLPSLLQPRTVRIKSSSPGLPWTEAQPIIQKGFNDIMTGTAPRIARRQIGDALWQRAARNGAPVEIGEFYVESRGLEALGSGTFLAQTAARYGFTGDFDFRLLGQDKLVDLLGTPDSPTLLGALVPFAVDGLAAGRPGPQGTTEYDGELLPDGRIVVNGLTVYRTADGT